MSEKLKLGVAVALVVAVAAVFVVRTRSALEDAGDEISGTDNWQITVEDHTSDPVGVVNPSRSSAPELIV